ncbi:alpha/beta hydrolase [Sphingomonas sp.]|uniref:alpha/beta fold hydrolase n=1 Tax=Sphingomonas sp. TaxID=28214 RepID=UPI00286B9B2A|nr:alpha/beta hydrolase [Sphingomonas sp.]
MPRPGFFALDDGRRIAFHFRAGAAGRPTLVILPGYASDMRGTKALAVDAFSARTCCGCLRLDYSGTGESSGDFADGTLAHWLDEVLAAIDRLTEGPLILVGSSMGGWLMLHVALRRAERVAALVGIAAAPDFTDWGFTADEKRALLDNGRLDRPNAYGPEPSVTHSAFWRSGEAMRLLDAAIAINCPVRLLHGDQDEDVPIDVPLKLLAQLRSADVQLHLLKGGGHRLSEPHEIDALLRLLVALVETRI